MEYIITDQERLEQSLFILRNDQSRNIPFVHAKDFLLTHKSDQSLKSEILRMIAEAGSVVKICSFIITDQDIFDSLLQKAKLGKTAIFILTQLDPSKFFTSSLLTEEEYVENQFRRHTDVIKTLYNEGVHVRAAETAHAKFIIADRAEAVLMSANLTNPSMTINTESGFVLKDDEVKALDLLFDVIFQKGAPYKKYLTAGKDKQYIVQAKEVVKAAWLPAYQSSRLRFTYENLTDNLYKSILEIVSSSGKYLYLSSYSIVGLAKLPELVDAIGKAVGRGVDVSIFCRGMNYRPDHLESCDILLKMGCRLFGDLDNHSKGIVSESQGILFTANIDGNHGLTCGFEVGVLLTESQRLEFLRFHQYLIDTAVYEFLSNPVRRQYFNTYYFYAESKGITPVFSPSICIRVKDSHTSELALLQSYGLFLGLDDDQKPYVITGRKTFSCLREDNGVFILLEETGKAGNLAKYLITYRELKIEIQ